MKKMLFVAAAISLLNACSESVYEYPNGSAGGTNDGDVHEGALCNVATDEAFCTSNGYAMQCINNEWDLLECNIGCKGGVCIEKEQIKEESCEGEEIYNWCKDDHTLAYGCKHTYVKDSGIVISTMTCAAGCNYVTAECYECDNRDIKCCDDNDYACQKICIDHKCIPKSTLSCLIEPEFKCDKDDDGQILDAYTLYCNEAAIEGFVNVQCEDNKKCSENRKGCVECTANEHCTNTDDNSKPYCNDSNTCVECTENAHCSENMPICNNGVCEECPPEHDFDPEKNECVERFKCPPEQIIDPDSNECIDKCGMDGVKAYLKQNESAYKEYGITADVLNDACIISYDADQSHTALSCGKLNPDKQDIIFCGTVYLDEFDGLIDNIKGRKIFGVHDATITSHESTTIRNPLFGAVTDSTLYNFSIKNILFNIIGNDEREILGIIESVGVADNTKDTISHITIENVSIISNTTSPKALGGFIGEANQLSLDNITINNLSINVTESQGNVGGLIGHAKGVTFKKPTINGININALNSATPTAAYENIGGVIGLGQDITISGGDINDITIATDMYDVGGLIGDSIGVVINPNAGETLNISINSIAGHEDVGGLIGEANGSVEINNGSDDSVLNITTKYVKGVADVGGVIGDSNYAQLSLHHIRNTVSTIHGVLYAAGVIGYLYKETDEPNNDGKMDIVIDDIHNECNNTESGCISDAQTSAGFIGYFGVSGKASASITNVNNSFPNATISAIYDAAGFIGDMSIYTEDPTELTIDNIISNVGEIKGTDRVGGFISNISFGSADAEDPRLTISNVTSNAIVFAPNEESSDNNQLYNIVSAHFTTRDYLANKLKIDGIYTQNKGAGFINTINYNWYTISNQALSNKYIESTDYYCCKPSRICTSDSSNSCAQEYRYYKWPPNFEMNFYENAFRSKLSVSNIAVKHDTQNLNATNRQKHNGYNTLSRYIDKINQRACAGSDNDNLLKSLDQMNAFNSIYRNNIFIYSIINYESLLNPSGRPSERYVVNHKYSYPLNDCDYSDFNVNNANDIKNIYIMYDKYCNTDKSTECGEDNIAETDVIKAVTNENAYHVTEVPKIINTENTQTWRYDEKLGLPVPALQGIVVKQAEPLPFEPIDPDDSREPAPDSPVEP